jgi:hypothetical protein
MVRRFMIGRHQNQQVYGVLQHADAIELHATCYAA